MIFHFQRKRCLYIFAGQRSKEFLNDFLTYNIDTGQIDMIVDGTKKDAQGGTVSSQSILFDQPVHHPYYRHVLKDFVKTSGENWVITSQSLNVLVFSTIHYHKVHVSLHT